MRKKPKTQTKQPHKILSKQIDLTGAGILLTSHATDLCWQASNHSPLVATLPGLTERMEISSSS